MFREHRMRCVLSFVAVLGLLVLPQAVSAEEQEVEREDFEAFAVVMGNIGTGLSSTVSITITRWTTDEERAHMFQTLIDEGSDDALEELEDLEETGFIRLPNTLGYRLRWARQEVVEGRRRIILATDRLIPFWEQIYGGRSRDYDFSIIQLDVDEEGNGEGVIAVAVRIKMDAESGSLYLENYSSEPIRLTRVRKR